MENVQNTNNKQMNVAAIFVSLILLVAFFLPLIKSFNISCYDIVFNQNFVVKLLLPDPDYRFVLLIFPLSAILKIIDEVTFRTFDDWFSVMIKYFPIITLIIFFARLLISVPLKDNDWLSHIINYIGIGTWLTLVTSLILPFLNSSSDNSIIKAEIFEGSKHKSTIERLNTNNEPALFEKLKSTEVNSMDKEHTIVNNTDLHKNKIEQLKLLKQLFDEGILTQEEFDQQKSQIL